MTDENKENINLKTIIGGESISTNIIGDDNINDMESRFLSSERDAEECDESSIEERGLLNRLFGKMEPGSLRGSIFTLATMTMGTGCMAMPQILSRVGFVEGILFIVAIAFVSYWALNVLSLMSEKYNIYQYSDLVERLFGKKLSFYLDVLIWVNYYAVLISYIVISKICFNFTLVNKLLGIVAYDFFYTGDDDYKHSVDFLENSFWASLGTKAIVNYSVVLIFCLPLCLLRDMSKLGKISIISIISFLYIIIVIIAQCPMYMRRNSEMIPPVEYNWTNISPAFTEKLLFFSSFASIFFANGNAVGALPVYKGLKNHTIRRVRKVSLRSGFLITTIYVIISIFGYLSVPINTPDLIIFRNSIQTSDIVMTIGKIMLIISLLISIAPNFGLVRISAIKLIKGGDEDYSDKFNLIFTISILFTTSTVATAYDQVQSLLALIGGFMSVIAAYFVPGAIYIKGNEYKIGHWKNVLSLILIILLVTIGWAAGVLEIINKIRGD